MIDILGQVIYYKYYAEVVEAYGINVSDAGAVPAASTISTLVVRRDVLVAQRSCRYVKGQSAFDGGEIGSTCVVKVRGDRKLIVNANDNVAYRQALAA